jgi:xanthine dehydrogenase accessory factor
MMVTLVECLGSAPQDAGARMLVTAAGLHAGTVGGGRVEAKAIAHALSMLEAAQPLPQLVSWTLKGDVGMTCGGSVRFFFEPFRTAVWRIAIFGAGHIAQALVPLLLKLKCDLTVCDPRREWLEKLPSAPRLRTLALADPAEFVDTLPGGAFVVCMTQGHSTDLPVLRRALEQDRFPFIGVIGSKAKAAVLQRDLVKGGLSEQRAAGFHCPIGLDFGTNDPAEIAISIGAQLLTERDRCFQPPRANGGGQS